MPRPPPGDRGDDHPARPFPDPDPYDGGPLTRPVIIDTDGGVDDAAALWWAVRDPTLDVIAVTVVWGNVGVDVAMRSVGRVLAAAGRADILVARGAEGPVGAAPALRPATFIHGEDGLGNTTSGQPQPAMTVSSEAAPALLGRLCRERPGQVSVLTIGPLSNLGLVLAEDPGFVATVRELVVMGGSARAGGNALPAGEANIAHDPVAAARVASAPWSQPPLLVGLDVTREATLTDAHFALLAEHRSAAAQFLDAPLRFYRTFGSAQTSPHCPCHDLVATMALAQPSLIPDAPVLPMAVDAAGGPAWGTTVVDFRAPAIARMRGGRAGEHRGVDEGGHRGGHAGGHRGGHAGGHRGRHEDGHGGVDEGGHRGGHEEGLGGGLASDARDQPPGFGPWRIGLGADVARFREQAAALFGA